MVKFSFSLSKPGQNEKENSVSKNKLTNVFAKPEINQERPIKKQIITELSTNNNISNDQDDDELNKYVIPCKNSLKDLKSEVKRDEIKKPVGELKFGLNVLFENVENESKEESNVNSGPENAPAAALDESASLATNNDDQIAKLIIEETNRKRLHEELFGTNDLVAKSQKTTPILLRSRLNASTHIGLNRSDSSSTPDTDEAKGDQFSKRSRIGGSFGSGMGSKSDSGTGLEKDVDIKELLEIKMDQYENVPVENFGLAMLLGMGFDPKNNKNEPKVYKRRVYDRAGLGADSVMKTNMESLMDTNLMSKLKRNHIYNIVDGTATTLNWALPGIIVKITDKNHKYYKQKGVVKSVNNNKVVLKLQGAEEQVNFKYLETVVSRDHALHKVVRRIPMNSKKTYIEVGSLVKLIDVMDNQAKILYEKDELVVSLDSISQMSSSPNV